MEFFNTLSDASSHPWQWGWDAVAALVTAAGVLIALIATTWEAGAALLDRYRRRRIVASSVLHAIQLAKNHLEAVSELLGEFGTVDRSDVATVGKALINSHSAPLARGVEQFSVFGVDIACDLAYAVSLSESIDGWGKWLSEIIGKPDDTQWENITLHADFFSEAALQSAQSLANVEVAVKGVVPKAILVRRFGPELKKE